MGDSLVPLMFLVLLAAAFWLLIIRPAKARARAHEQVVRSIVPGSRIMTASGIYGTVVESADGRVQVEVAPGVVVTIIDQAVAQVLADEPAPDRPGTVDPPASSTG